MSDSTQPPKRVGIVGAGFMGSGIAESVAAAGIEGVLHEPDSGPLELSRDRIDALGRASGEGREALGRGGRGRFRDASPGPPISTPSSRPISSSRRSLRSSPRSRRSSASSTTCFPRTRFWPRTPRRSRSPGSPPPPSRPERVLGLHFFRPVPVMKLVEVVVGLDTSDETVATAEAFASQIGKKPIRTKDRSGFIVNFLLVPYLMAAVRMYEEGFAGREDIDEGMKHGCGHPMGPLTLCDLIGLDVLYSRLRVAVRRVQARRVRAAAAAQADGRLRAPGAEDGPGLLHVRARGRACAGGRMTTAVETAPLYALPPGPPRPARGDPGDSRRRGAAACRRDR